METISQTHQPIPKSTPRDFFAHLLSSILLYVSAASFVTVMFQLINIKIPDAIETGDYQVINAKNTLRNALSALIVFFPVYLLLMSYLQRIYKKDSAMRNLRIRRWLIYFTLFIASLIILGSLASVVNRFLGGELTLRFGLKILTLIFVTGAIFGYYLWDVRRHSTQ